MHELDDWVWVRNVGLALFLLLGSFFFIEVWSERLRRIQHIEGRDVFWNEVNSFQLFDDWRWYNNID